MFVQIEPPPGWMPATFAGPWGMLAAYPALLALVVAVGGVLLALLVRYVTVFYGLRFTKRSPSDLDDHLLRLLAGVLPVVILFVSLMTAVRVLPLNAAATLVINRVLGTLMLLILVRMSFRASFLGLRALGKFRDRYHVVEERTIPLFDLMATMTIAGLGVFAFLSVWDIDPTGWLASAGIVGIVVGFGAKDTLANLFAGIFIIADAPYKLGDFIVLDSGERGEVTRVGIRSTRMLTQDDVEVIIPNGLMANQKIVNESGGRWLKSRLKLRVGVAYGTDVDRLMHLLEEIGRRHDNVAHDPNPCARMAGFGESSVDFDLQVWINHPSLRGAVTHQLYVDIYKTLAKEGIEIPFPQRDVWVKQVPEGLGMADGRGEASLQSPGPEEQDDTVLARKPM